MSESNPEANTQNTPQTSPESKADNTLDLNLVELLNLAAKLLHTMFVQAPKDKAKPVFKEIKHGKTVPLGSVTIDQKLRSELSLALDYSEFVGPGFNFDIFTLALKGILRQISDQFKTKGDLQVMNSEDGKVLFHLPGAVEVNGQLNVLLIAFDLANIKAITIRLMFVEPDQYAPYRKKV